MKLIFSRILKMISYVVTVLSVLMVGWVRSEDYIHQPIQYHSQTDSGTYNYGYDTGLFGAHQFHQEHKDAAGEVRGRYGYTDPNGKLRLVHYKSGPKGFEIISDTESTNTERPKAIRRQETSLNSIESARSQYKPIYSRDYYRKPIDTTPVKPVPLRKPRVTRTYRESGNSRLYLAGRDYGSPSVESPRLPYTRGHVHHHHDHYSHNYRAPAVTPRESVRSVFHRARPTSPPPRSHVHHIAPAVLPVDTHAHVPEVRESIIHGSPVTTSHVHTAPAVLPIDNHIHSAPAPVPVFPAVSPYEAPIPLAPARLPVVYSGRGIPSPVARLREAAARASAIAARRAGISGDGVRASRSVKPEDK